MLLWSFPGGLLDASQCLEMSLEEQAFDCQINELLYTDFFLFRSSVFSHISMIVHCFYNI